MRLILSRLQLLTSDWHIEAQKSDRQYVDDIMKCIFFYKNTECSFDNKSSLIQLLAWRQTGDTPLS